FGAVRKIGCCAWRALLAPKTWFSRYWREILLAATSVLAAYCIVEVAYRIYEYKTLPERLFRIGSAQLQNHRRGTLFFDEHTGFRYAPFADGHMGPPFNSHWRTNSHGHVSQVEYPRQKPPGEYRIAVVGDSMTANVTNNVRWTELVEQQLNATPKWRAFVGGRFTRVINFGVHMMGMVQFAAMLRHHVLEFDPDLIIVNFISDDVRRRIIFQALPDATSDAEDRLRLYIKTNILYEIDWFRIYPEVFAATIGRLWNMRCHLPPDERLIWARSANFTYPNRTEAIPASAAAVRDMLDFSRSEQRMILFLKQPQADELDDIDLPRDEGLVEDLQRAAPEFMFIDMKPRMAALLNGKRLKDRPDLAGMTRQDIARLPDSKKLEVYRWFYLPDDPHYTDYGTTLYGREVADFLVDASGRHFKP